MNTSLPPLILSMQLMATSCSVTDEPDGGLPDAGPLPTEMCPEAPSLHTLDRPAESSAVEPGGYLPIALGFQGFIMARISIGTEQALRPATDVTSWITVDGFEEASASHRGVVSRAAPGGGFRTDEILLFFNDAPLPELVGRRASVRLRAYEEACVAWCERPVTLELVESSTTT
ncbi:MAG: hypothetical protein HYV07_21640 [Deltaproteobacteria bacterium]|nr:hypothetical protein [Deltaproteobacteria bacterium]